MDDILQKAWTLLVRTQEGKIMKRFSRVYSFMAAVALFSTSSVVSAADKKVIKVGVGAPLTGANAAFGEQLLRGTQKAVEDINKAGGIKGQMLEVVKGDDACEPKQAVAVANRMIDQDKVNVVIGHFCSSASIPASDVYADAGVLMITPASTNPLVTDRNLPTIMRNCGRDDQQGTIAADFIKDKLKAQRVAIVHDKTTYGQGLAESMKARLNKLGIKEVLFEGLTKGEKDFNALVTKFKSVKADVVYFGGVHAEAGLLVNQMHNQGVKAKFVSGDGIMSTDFVTAAGGPKYAEGVYNSFGPDPRKIPTAKPIVEEFKKSGYEPEGYTLYSYATMQAIAKAIEATGTTDGKKLADWLKSNPVDTVIGKKEWDKKGDLKTSDYVMYQWDSKGSYRQL